MKINTISPSFQGLKFIDAMNEPYSKDTKAKIKEIAEDNGNKKTINSLEGDDFDIYVTLEKGMINFKLKDNLDNKGSKNIDAIHPSDIDRQSVTAILEKAYYMAL